jgi:dipeptidyl aminopeptidase/acylaminoacyl peptidase
MAAEKRSLTLDDFWRLKIVDDPQLSPDGATAAYVVEQYDEQSNEARSAIWLVPLSGGPARRFTSGEAMDSMPRWSPDGDRLAFVSTRHEGKPQVFVMPASSGEPRRVTSSEAGASAPVWSPDGMWLCYTEVVPSDRQEVSSETEWFKSHPKAKEGAGRLRRINTLVSRMDGRGYIDNRMHLFVVSADDPAAKPRQLTDGDHDDTSAIWSPDGSVIAFVSSRMKDAEHNAFAADIWTVDVESGDLRCLTDSSHMIMMPAWSPDGETIAFYGGKMPAPLGRVHVCTVSRQGGDIRDASQALDQQQRFVQTDYMWPVGSAPAWSPDGRTIYCNLVDHRETPVFAVSLDTGEVRRLGPAMGDVASIACTPDGRTLLCLASTPTQPFDLFTLPATGGELTSLTHSNADLLKEAEPVPCEDITAEGPDGLQIEGWLYRPANAEPPYPLILNIHGGPEAAWGHSFHFQAQALAGAGYASLYVNPRGSVGQGWEFTAAVDWGKKDYEDLMAGVDAALAQGGFDPDKLGVTGISGGGFFTSWIVGHTDRFAGAVAVNGVYDQFTSYGVGDMIANWFQNEFGGPFWESEEQWQKYRFHSPIAYVDKISTPIRFLQGEVDYRCPIPQGEQMLTALRVRKQTTDLIRFPGVSHGITRTGTPHQRFMYYALIHDWFDTYVKRVQPEEQISTEDAGVTPEQVPVP